MVKKFLAITLLAATPAFAQQPQQMSAAELALQINGYVTQMAQGLAQQGKVITDLQKKNAELEAKIKDLEGKSEDKK